MTTFPDGVYQYGGVPVGVGRLSEIFEAGNIWFVDNDNGSSAYTGKRPDWAFDLPSTAVAAASKGGVIYIRPRTTTASADNKYTDNVTIPATKCMLSLIGAGNGYPAYRGAVNMVPSTTTTHTINVQASGCSIENMTFDHTTATAGNAINCVRSATIQAICLTVKNCRFLGNTILPGSDGTTVTGTIGLGSAQYSHIEDNVFLKCSSGITMWATSGSPMSIIIRRNVFSGMVLSRDCDIVIGISDIQSTGHVIADNIFADGLPNMSTGSYKDFIHDCYAVTSVATGIICGNHFATLTPSEMHTDGTECTLAAGWFLTGNFYGGVTATAPYGLATKV